MLTRDPKNHREVRVELTLDALRRIEKLAWSSGRSVPEQAVLMVRFAFQRMHPPQTAEDWWKVMGREDLSHLLRAVLRISKFTARNHLGLPNATFVSRYGPDGSVKYHRLALHIPEEMMRRLEGVARSRLIPVSEAAENTIEYALAEVFPERTPEETDRELRETWRKIRRAMWSRA